MEELIGEEDMDVTFTVPEPAVLVVTWFSGLVLLVTLREYFGAEPPAPGLL